MVFKSLIFRLWCGKYISADNCPGVLRIKRADENYKTLLQWRTLGYEPIIPEGRVTPRRDAVSIVHSTEWHEYYHRDNVHKIGQVG